LAALRCADGEPLPVHVRDEIVRELDRLDFVNAQIAALEKQRAADIAVAPADDGAVRQLKALLRLRGFGMEF
jgi:transposase